MRYQFRSWKKYNLEYNKKYYRSLVELSGDDYYTFTLKVVQYTLTQETSDNNSEQAII